MQGITLMPRLTMKVIPATRTMEVTMNNFLLIANAVGGTHV